MPIARRKAGDNSPGSFGCHEALHEAGLYAAWLDEYCEHPAIAASDEWTELARKAADAMAELYQSIGRKHFET